MQRSAKQSKGMQRNAKQSKETQSKAMQSEAKQGEAKQKQSKATQSKAMQSNAKQCNAKQSNAKVSKGLLVAIWLKLAAACLWLASPSDAFHILAWPRQMTSSSNMLCQLRVVLHPRHCRRRLR